MVVLLHDEEVLPLAAEERAEMAEGWLIGIM
jgi:hypothetical protein